MVKKLKFLIIFFILSSPLKSEIVENIVINGNKRVSDETIKIYGEINNITEYSQNNANQILKNLYETGFFENIEISFKNKNLIVNVKEYPIVNQLIIVGEKTKKFEDQIREIILTKEKKSFNKSNLAKDVNLIKSLYSSLGYNFINIETKIKKINEDNFDLLIEIERGNKTKISKHS